jgi:uncharacterized coiled-coil DUF342 family protein
MRCNWVVIIEQYITLEGKKFSIDELSKQEQGVYRRMRKLVEEGAESWELSNIYRCEIENIRGKRSRREMVLTPIYQICEDLESRLEIREGVARPP